MYRTVRQGLWWLLGAGLVLPVAATALAEFGGLARLPYALRPLAARLPTVFAVHMGASALSLPLIFLALSVRPPRRLHRWFGRAAALCVVVGGLAAIPSSLQSNAILAARLGFLTQALVWLGLLAFGLAAIRARRIRQHREAMTMMAATASGAIVLRLVLYPVGWLWLPFAATYASIAWLGWLVPLVLTYGWLHRARRAQGAGIGSRRPPAAASPAA